MEALVIIEEQVDEAEKERNTMIYQLKSNLDEEIFKLKSDLNLFMVEAKLKESRKKWREV